MASDGDDSANGSVSASGHSAPDDGQLVSMSTTTAVPDPRICEPGGRGFLFPLLESEQYWPVFIRAVLYVAALCWIFLGIAIIADKFVASIEAVTSKKLRVKVKAEGRVKTIKLWNATVANLTLMALGSSAPEILLSIIEALKNGFHAGDLGPSTIVGSAAFNLFMIIAVCIVSIPSPSVRIIKETGVFFVTAVFSIVAYLWLVFIVAISSPDVIDPWEGVVTLLMMPVLVWISWLSDIGYFGKKSSSPPESPGGSFADVEVAGAAGGALRDNYARNRAHSWGGPGQHPSPTSPGKRGAPEPLGRRNVICDAKGRAISNPHGILAFDDDQIEVMGTTSEKTVFVSVHRRNGKQGEISCSYRTETLSAVPDKDYTHEEGTLSFGHNLAEAQIPIKLLPKSLCEHSDKFQLILEEPEGGATFNPNDDGEEKCAILTITIRNENEALTKGSMAMRVITVADGAVNMDSLAHATTIWINDIKDALFQVTDSEEEPPSGFDWFMHLIGVPWKFGFALLVPPPAYAGGWICFVVSLVMIGGLTSIVCDFAELLGCVCGIENSIVAITFVALGTSMPDLFASKTAATQDEYADASIVNVTGSNSVNVFLGIGVPWTMSAFYWMDVGATEEWQLRYPTYYADYPGGAFIVKGGDLGFSVVAFTIGALIALGVIQGRRMKFGGELGGPYAVKMMSGLLLSLLWLFYIIMSIWKTLTPEATGSEQVWALIKGLFMLQNLVLVCGGALYFFNRSEASEQQGASRGLELSVLDESGTSPSSGDMNMPPMAPPHSPPRDAEHVGLLTNRAREHWKTAGQKSLAVVRLAGAAGPITTGGDQGPRYRGHSDPGFTSGVGGAPHFPAAGFGDGLRQIGRDQHAGAQGPAAAVFGRPSPGRPVSPAPDSRGTLDENDAVLRTVTAAVYTGWAAIRLRQNADAARDRVQLGRQGSSTFHDAEGDEGAIDRTPSFYSVGTAGVAPIGQSASTGVAHTAGTGNTALSGTPSPVMDRLRRLGGNTAEFLNDHKQDFLAIWLAGFLASQASDPSGNLLGQ